MSATRKGINPLLFLLVGCFGFIVLTLWNQGITPIPNNVGAATGAKESAVLLPHFEYHHDCDAERNQFISGSVSADWHECQTAPEGANSKWYAIVEQAGGQALVVVVMVIGSIAVFWTAFKRKSKADAETYCQRRDQWK